MSNVSQTHYFTDEVYVSRLAPLLQLYSELLLLSEYHVHRHFYFFNYFFCSARNSSGKSSLRLKTSVCTGTQSVRCWEDTLKIRSRSVIEQRPAGAGFQHWAVVSPRFVTLQSANVMEQSYKDFVQAFSCIDIKYLCMCTCIWMYRYCICMYIIWIYCTSFSDVELMMMFYHERVLREFGISK